MKFSQKELYFKCLNHSSITLAALTCTRYPRIGFVMLFQCWRRGGKVLHHITSSFPKLDMCLIRLAGWFSLEPVNKKFDPSSLVSIPTPPCHASTISWQHHLSLYSFSTPHLPPLTHWGLWSWPSWLRTALFKPWQRQKAVTRLLCRWTPLWLICRTTFERRPWASERSHDVIRVFLVFSVFWETIWNALESE